MTHRNLWVNAVTFGMHMQVSDRDVYLHTLPMFHCNGWGLPYTMAGLGARQIVLRKVDGAEILRRVEQHGVTMMAGAPAVWNAVLEAAANWDGEIPGRDQVRIVVAGAPPPSRTIARVEAELGWEFNQIYGLTETAPLLTINRPRAEYDDLEPEERAKQAVPGRRARARHPDAAPARPARCWPRATSCSPATGRTRDASAEALEGGWFHTGDGGSIDDGGYLTISDRKKDVIITGGENVSSIEVEDAVFSHPAVAEVAVIGVPDDKWGEMVTAIVVVAEGEQVTEADIIAHCRGKIAGYKIPKRIEFRDELARTATGKIQKFKLRDAFWAGLRAQGQLAVPPAGVVSPSGERLTRRGPSFALTRLRCGALPGAVSRAAAPAEAAARKSNVAAYPDASRARPARVGRRSPRHRRWPLGRAGAAVAGPSDSEIAAARAAADAVAAPDRRR